MTSPKIIGIASIIPGLGFGLLGQYRRSISAFILTIAFLAAAVLTSIYLPGPVSKSIWYMTVVIWIGQIYFSADTANLLNKQSAKKVEHTIITNPRGLSKNERFIKNVLGTVKQQLASTEQLQAAIFGFYFVAGEDDITVQFPTRPLYLAITDTDLIIMKTDFLGSPMILERIEKNQIKSFDSKQGFFNDTLQCCYIKDAKYNSLKIKVSFRLREQTRTIISLAHKLIGQDS